MPRMETPQLQSVSEFVRVLRDPGVDLKNKFRKDPIGLAERFGLRLPEKPVQVMQRLGVYDPEKHGPLTPGLRDLVEDVCLGHIEDAVAVGPRGGGKSQGVSFIEFFLTFVREFDALNMGGSELQAENVYHYLLAYMEADPYWKTLVKGETLQSKTTLTSGNWIRVLTASSKSVRSPHAGGIKNGKMRGGLLVIDEEAEAEEENVKAALATINTARPSVNVRCSTFHNAEGSFAELVESHEEMGYKMYDWTIFDICEKCPCKNKCENPDPCFREDHVEMVADPDTGNVEEKIVHKAYCGGKAMYADGWIPVEEINKLFNRYKRNHARFEVEAMGSRPKSAGFVIKDKIAFAQNTVSETGAQLYKPGNPVTICVDWGSSAAGVEVWQEQPRDQHVLLLAEQLEEAGESQILGRIIELWNFYPEAQEIAADIGGGGNYLNPKLREENGLPVRDVNFAEEKETAASAWNIYNEAHKVKYPEEFTDFRRQVRKWRRKNGRIVKGDDHLCDTALCYFAKFVDRLNIRKIAVRPRTFSATSSISDAPRQQREAGRQATGRVAPRMPVARGLRGR